MPKHKHVPRLNAMRPVLDALGRASKIVASYETTCAVRGCEETLRLTLWAEQEPDATVGGGWSLDGDVYSKGSD